MAGTDRLFASASATAGTIAFITQVRHNSFPRDQEEQYGDDCSPELRGWMVHKGPTERASSFMTETAPKGISWSVLGKMETTADLSESELGRMGLSGHREIQEMGGTGIGSGCHTERGQVTFYMGSVQEFEFHPGNKGVLRNPLVFYFIFKLQHEHLLTQRSLHFGSFPWVDPSTAMRAV